jgi:hypothetical protein
VRCFELVWLCRECCIDWVTQTAAMVLWDVCYVQSLAETKSQKIIAKVLTIHVTFWNKVLTPCLFGMLLDPS